MIKKRNIPRLILIGFSLLLAIFYYAQASHAFGFIVPISAMFAFLAFPLFFFVAILTFFIDVLQRKKIRDFSYTAFACSFVLFAGIFLGTKRTQKLQKETESRGDIILEHIETYRDTVGKCPNELDELNTTIPLPVLKKTDYKLIEIEGKCGVLFGSTAMFVCRKTVEQETWDCRD